MRTQAVQLPLYAGIVLGEAVIVIAALSFGVGPLWLLLGLVALVCLPVALARFPAVFFVPLLFVSREMPLPVNPFHNVIDVKALPLGTALLCAALFVRLMTPFSDRPSVPLRDLFRNQGRRISAFLLFAAMVVISYLHTRSPQYGGDKLLSFLIVGGLMFFAPFILLRDEKDFRHFALGTVALALALSASRLVADTRGVFGQHEDVAHVGIGQLIGMAILLTLNFKFLDSRLGRYLLILSLPLLAAGLIAAEERGPLLSLTLVLIACLFARRRQITLVSPRTLMLGIAVIAVTLFVVPETWFRGEAATKFRLKNEELMNFVHGGSYSSEGSGGRRLYFFKAALDGISQKPIAGWGVGGWSYYYFHQDDWHYPHNLFLEVLFEEGLLGLVPCLFLIVAAFKAAKTAFGEVHGRFAFLLPLLAYFVLIISTSGDIDDCRFLWFGCSMAFVASRIIESERQAEAETRGALGS